MGRRVIVFLGRAKGRNTVTLLVEEDESLEGALICLFNKLLLSIGCLLDILGEEEIFLYSCSFFWLV